MSTFVRFFLLPHILSIQPQTTGREGLVNGTMTLSHLFFSNRTDGLVKLEQKVSRLASSTSAKSFVQYTVKKKRKKKHANVWLFVELWKLSQPVCRWIFPSWKYRMNGERLWYRKLKEYPRLRPYIFSIAQITVVRMTTKNIFCSTKCKERQFNP